MANAFQSLDKTPQFSPLSVIFTVWRRKGVILALTLLGTGGTAAFVSRLSPVFTANAVILVESQKIPETFVAATVQTGLEAQLDTLKQQVLSTDRLWGLVETLNLYSEERRKLTKEEVLRTMRRDIRISLTRGWSSNGPGAFQVEYEAPRAEIAADVTNQIGMFFINENLRQRTTEAAATAQFLDRQLAAADDRLRGQEAKLKEFKLSNSGELPEQESALLSAVGQARTELLGIQEALGRAQQNKLILESSLAYAQANLRERQDRRSAALSTAASRETIVSAQPAAPTAAEQAEAELSRLRSRYHDSHPEVQRAEFELRRLRKAHQDRPPAQPAEPAAPVQSAAGQGPPPAGIGDEGIDVERSRIQELKAQITIVAQETVNLEERRERVLQEVASVQKRLQMLPVREQQLAVITRDYDTSKQNYQSLLNKKLAADVATEMERWHKSQKFVMLDPARVPQKPTRPRRQMLTGAGALISCALATGLVFLAELRRNRLLGEWELPQGSAVLGRIPRMKVEPA